MYWSVRRHRLVTNYLQSPNIPDSLRDAIASLSGGIPEEAERIDNGTGPETWEWLEARHWIYFTVDRTVNQRTIRVTVVESATEEL